MSPTEDDRLINQYKVYHVGHSIRQTYGFQLSDQTETKGKLD